MKQPFGFLLFLSSLTPLSLILSLYFCIPLSNNNITPLSRQLSGVFSLIHILYLLLLSFCLPCTNKSMLANDNHASSHNHQQQPPSSSPPPKAVNIVRPSSPFVNGPHHQRPHHDSPLLSRPSVLGTTNFFSLYATQHAHTFGNGPISWPQHLLQRARSSSNLSRNSMLSSEDDIDNDQDQIDSIDGNDDDSIDEEEDSIDGISDSSSSIHDDIIDDRPRSIIQMDDISSSSSSNEDEEEVSPSKIVARIKNGTIMNGRGEFLNKGGNDEEDDDDHDGWLDEARANRKVWMMENGKGERVSE